jgi:hypothetical protein
MLPDHEPSCQKWLAKYGERIRLLSALQEQAVQANDWDALQQLLQEQEQLLRSLEQYLPSHIPPELLEFAHEIWQRNQRLQQMVEQQLRRLRTELADLQYSRDAVKRYRTVPPSAKMEDHAA